MTYYSPEFVEMYDLIYSRMKNYRDEADTVAAWIRKFHPHAASILDVACGTAEHARFLKTRYRLDGLDLSEDFLRIARRKNPECGYYQGDMSDFSLNRKYDVVMSLFSSIGYVLTFDKLKGAIAAFKNHLAPDGIILIEPWFSPDQWSPGQKAHMITVDEPELKVCRMHYSAVRDGNSFMEFNFMIGTPTKVETFKEEHILALFTREQMVQAFELNGLEVDFDEKGLFGRGLYIGRLMDRLK